MRGHLDAAREMLTSLDVKLRPRSLQCPLPDNGEPIINLGNAVRRGCLPEVERCVALGDDIDELDEV